MRKQLFIHRYWKYDGSHPNGKDRPLSGDELPKLKNLLGICQDSDEEKMFLLFAVESGETVTINGHEVRIESIRIGKSDGFGREIEYKFRLLK